MPEQVATLRNAACGLAPHAKPPGRPGRIEGREAAFSAYLPNLLTLLLLVLIGANYFGTFADLDFSWQIRTGERIVQTGALRPTDAFSYTIAGKQVEDFEWLYEVILYGIWTTFGFGGLKFLRVVLVAAPLVLLGLRLRRDGVRWHGIALCLLTAILVVAPAWNLRPMYCTTIGLFLTWSWLHDHCTARRSLSWALPIVLLLWANLHPGIILGQGLLFGAICWEWLNQRLRWHAPLDRAALRRLTLIGSLGLAATFLSPDPIARLLYAFNPDLAHPVFRQFVEMQPLYTFVMRPPFAIGLVYVVAALVLVSAIVRFRHYRGWELMLLLGLAALANLAVRSLQDWLILMLAVGVPHVVALLAQVGRAARRRLWGAALLRLDRGCKRILAGPMLRLQPHFLVLAMLALLLVSVTPSLSRPMPLQDAPEWPRAAVAYIEHVKLHGRFFAPPDYSSYLTWRLGTRVRTYSDTRGFFFPPLLVEDSILLPKLDDDWQTRLRRVLDDYGTDYFLLETTGDRGELWRRAQQAGARPLYLDDTTVLLAAAEVRRLLP